MNERETNQHRAGHLIEQAVRSIEGVTAVRITAGPRHRDDWQDQKFIGRTIVANIELEIDPEFFTQKGIAL